MWLLLTAFIFKYFVRYLDTLVLKEQVRLRKLAGIPKSHRANMLLKRDTDPSFPSPMVSVF